MGVSWNCQSGEPGRRHPDCTGCACDCHATRPPGNFRELVEAARGGPPDNPEQVEVT